MSTSQQPPLEPQRTVGQALANTELRTAAVYTSLLVILIGSVGPWATTPFGSVSGTSGDGVMTLIAAVLAAIAFATKHGRVAAGLLVIALATSGYDAINGEHVASHTTLFGTQIVHLGWGIYAVIVGAIAGLIALFRARALTRAQPS